MNEAIGVVRVDAALRKWLVPALCVALSLYVLIEVNFALLTPLRELSLFGSAGIVLCFLLFPNPGSTPRSVARIVSDWLLILLAIVCCGYLVYFGSELGQRAGIYKTPDLVIGGIGLVLVVEAARRSIGWALPILALLFVLYAYQGIAQQLPDWLFPHRGQDVADVIGQTYLRTEGVFGTALGVMFRYVFLFVLFGAVLESSGATGYIISLANRIFGKRSGGPAKVAVLASGVMGSLSGSAVANAATTGTFTIPLMRSIGFSRSMAAGIEAAASSGGALVPPVMGAGAYMMLEIINRNPPVTYLEVCKAALIPALLYYLSIYLLVHFFAKKITAAAEHGSETVATPTPTRSEKKSPYEEGSVSDGSAAIQEVANEALQAPAPIFCLEGFTFFGALISLMTFLLMGNSPFRAVSYALAFVMVMIIVNPRTPATALQRVLALIIWGAITVLSWKLIPAVQTWQDGMIWGLAITLAVGLLAKTWRPLVLDGFIASGRGGVPLIVAAACVGIIIGLVSRTGIGTGVPQAIIPLAGNNLFLALLAIMGCSIILGMGLPSAVSYLLLATVIGPVFADPALGVPILAAHMFIFYFGMMAMVTPPVALAAYATSSIAGSGVMETGFAAFRFSLVGFTLPFMFVYRPELCLMAADGGPPALLSVVLSVIAAVFGIIALASALAGFMFSPLKIWQRLMLFAAAACSLYPDQTSIGSSQLSMIDATGAILLGIVAIVSLSQSRQHGLSAPK